MPAGISDDDRGVVAQHVEPNAMCLGQLAATETGAFHLFKQTGNRTIAIDLDGPRRRRKILRCFGFSLRNHKAFNLSDCEQRNDLPVHPAGKETNPTTSWGRN
jgi:hypothetical protein